MAELRLSWEIEGLQRLEQQLGKIERALEPPKLTAIMSKGAEEFKSAARQAAPKKSGALEGSIDKQNSGGANWVISPYVNPGANEEGTSTTVYAGVQESGSTHGPTTEPYMVFEGSAGALVFAKEVTIPGQHYMETGFAEGSPRAVEAVSKAFTAEMNV